MGKGSGAKSLLFCGSFYKNGELLFYNSFIFHQGGEFAHKKGRSGGNGALTRCRKSGAGKWLRFALVLGGFVPRWGRHKNSFAVFAHGAHNGVPRCYPPGQSMATCFSAVGCLGFPLAGVSWNWFRSLCAWGHMTECPVATRRGNPWRLAFQPLGAWGCRRRGFMKLLSQSLRMGHMTGCPVVPRRGSPWRMTFQPLGVRICRLRLSSVCFLCPFAQKRRAAGSAFQANLISPWCCCCDPPPVPTSNWSPGTAFLSG